MLDAAKGQTRIGSDHAVDEYGTGFEFFDKAALFVSVVGPGGSAETERRRVGEADGFVNVVYAEQHRDGAEDLLARHGCGGSDLHEHCRLVKISRPIHALATRKDARTCCYGSPYLFFNIVDELRGR